MANESSDADAGHPDRQADEPVKGLFLCADVHRTMSVFGVVIVGHVPDPLGLSLQAQ